jgi:TonB family protein
MSCTTVASILDTHRSTRLAPAERTHVDEHLAACGDCAAAWHAHGELLALPVPRVPATLLERVLLASRARRAAPRRLRMPLIVGSAMLAGAALASVTFVSLLRAPGETAAPAREAAAPQTSNVATVQERLAQAAPVDSATQLEHPTSVELVATGLDMLPLIRHAPVYPADALAEGAEGQVQLKFTITAAGAVENVSVVQSSDERFDAAAAEAVSKWRYLPRIEAGKRVGSGGVHTIVRFVLSGSDEPPARSDEEIAAASRDFAAFFAGLGVALDRLAADDFRGVELQLDELAAIHGAERLDLWNFYGYLYTVQGHYDRAIGAYETAVDIASRSPVPTSGPFLQLANLYFARHQYDLAMSTLLRPNLPGGNRVMSPAANELMQKLNALGITEESVAGP